MTDPATTTVPTHVLAPSGMRALIHAREHYPDHVDEIEPLVFDYEINLLTDVGDVVIEVAPGLYSDAVADAVAMIAIAGAEVRMTE